MSHYQMLIVSSADFVKLLLELMVQSMKVKLTNKEGMMAAE